MAGEIMQDGEWRRWLYKKRERSPERSLLWLKINSQVTGK